MVAQRALFHRKDIVSEDDTLMESVGELRVNYRGEFNASYLYVMMHEWFVENGFVPGRRLPDSNFRETNWVYRDMPGGGKDIWWFWRMRRESPSGALFRWHIDLTLHILGLKDTETIINGKKVKINSGEIDCFFNPYLFITTSRWDKNPLLKMMKPLLMTTVYAKRMEEERKLFDSTVWQAQEALKTYLKLETYMAEHEGFHAKADLTP